MKRVFACAGILVIMITFAVICEFYVSSQIKQTVQLLEDASQSRKNGDYYALREQVDSAWVKWRKFTKHSEYVLADLSIIGDITVSMSRVVALSETAQNAESEIDNGERLIEECSATILMLEHFLLNNQNISFGIQSK